MTAAGPYSVGFVGEGGDPECRTVDVVVCGAARAGGTAQAEGNPRHVADIVKRVFGWDR